MIVALLRQDYCVITLCLHQDSTKTCRKSGVKDDACGCCHVPGSFDI
jgi:hypothetical protein